MNALLSGGGSTPDPSDELTSLEDRISAGDIAGAQAIQARFWNGKGGLSETQYRRNPSLLAWNRDYDAAPDTDFLFVSGTPRSSTTALGKLLTTHPDVTLFIELYGANTGYVPQMFSFANIRRLLDAGFIKKPPKPENMELLELGQAGTMIGDKRPNFMESANLTLANFRGRRVNVLHLIRDVKEVAASYLRRRQAGTFPGSYDHVMAVKHVNMNNRNAVALAGQLAPEHRLFVLDYATFWSRPANARRLMRAIGLDPRQANRNDINVMFERSERLRERDRGLAAEASAYIEEHLDVQAAEQLRGMAFA